MTEYDARRGAHPRAFPPEHIADTLAETVSKKGPSPATYCRNGKYAHVTSFFNGGRKKSSLGKTASLFRRRMSRPMIYSLR